MHCGQELRGVARALHNLDPADHHITACGDLSEGLGELGIDLEVRELGDEDRDAELPYLVVKSLVDPCPHHPDDAALDMAVLLPLEAEAISKRYDEDAKQVSICRGNIHEHIYAVAPLAEQRSILVAGDVHPVEVG